MARKRSRPQPSSGIGIDLPVEIYFTYSFGMVDAAQIFINLAGIAIGGLIGFLSANRVSRLNARRQAAATLRAAFAPEIAQVRLAHSADKSIKIENVLKEAFPRHAAAIEAFRFYVKARDRAAFENAWREYYKVGGSIRFFNYYMDDAKFETFENKVNAFLRFAK
jgi:hypothetical protein